MEGRQDWGLRVFGIRCREEQEILPDAMKMNENLQLTGQGGDWARISLGCERDLG